MTLVQQQDTPGRIQVEELQVAEKIAGSFVSAFKYYSLYPEGHAFSKNYLDKFKNELDKFLKKHKRLRLDIERNGFSYKSHTIFGGTPDENNPAYLLSRDRILFLEFTRNIELSEISLLLDIFKRHRNPLDDADGDIATTLWHYRFGHIHYEAADIFAMETIQFDLAMFKAAPGLQNPDAGPGGGRGGGTGHHTQGQNGENGISPRDQSHREQVQIDTSPNGNAHYSHSGDGATEAPSSLHMLAMNKDLAELDQEEQKMLDFLIQKEENRDFTSDVIDILLITLSVEQNELDFAAVLEFLEFEFFDAMVREDFSLAFKICKNVNNISEALKTKKPWARSLINIFLIALAREERLGEMDWIKGYRKIASIPEINFQLLNILDNLPSEVIFTLGTLVTQVPSGNIHLRHKIIDSITAKAKENPDPLCQLIKKSSEKTNLLLLPVAEQLDDTDAAKVYLQMSHHSSSTIRKSGMDGLFRTNETNTEENIIHFMKDSDKEVRDRILSYLEQVDAILREKVLVSFLDQDNVTIDDELYIMHCYRLLSGCLSARSVEFLQKTLLESDLQSMFSHIRKAHKSGAAFALRTLGTKEAMQVLQKGAESMRPDIRQACRKALEH